MSDKFILDALHAHFKISACFVHLVDETDAGNFIFQPLSPDGFALRLNAFAAVKNGNRRVKHSKRTLHFCRKIDVAWSVNQIENPILPRTGGCCACYCNASLLLFFEVVHNGCAVVNFAHFVGFAGIKKYPFGHGCLAGINVSHYSDITNSFY